MKATGVNADTWREWTGDFRLRIHCCIKSLLKSLQPLLLLLILPTTALAQFNYTTTNGTITITGYTGPGGDVIIPSTIDGLPVTSIGSHAFTDCTSLISVTIPDSVTCMGEHAFYYCYGLTSVTIGNGVTDIADSTFACYPSLTSVTIPGSVTRIGDGAFIFCTSLPSVAIPDSVTHIADWAFFGCSSLTAITVDALNPVYSSVDGLLCDKRPDPAPPMSGRQSRRLHNPQQRHPHRAHCVR